MMKQKLKWIFFLLAVPVLVACNGGDSDSPNKPSIDKNQAPVAIVGANQNVTVGALVELDGKKSIDKDGDLITYLWSFKTQPEGSQAALSKADAVAPEFMADKAGSYVIELVVSDGKAKSSPAQLTIEVVPEAVNSVPTVNAGTDNTYAIGEAVQLQGEATDADGDTLVYSWVLTKKPSNSTPTLDNSDKKSAVLNASVQGQYTLKLTVSDGKVSVEDTVIITLEPANVAPISVAGDDQVVVIRTEVSLDGSASSDSNNDALLYEWAFVSKPESSVAELDNTLISVPSFTADLVGEYVLSLTVSDGALQSTADNVKITATEPVKNELKLVFGNDPEPKTWAFVPEIVTVNKTFNSAPKPTAYKLGSFTLEAVGQDFTIDEVFAMDVTNNVTPYITGVTVGQVIKAGEKIHVELFSPLTDGEEVTLSYAVISRDNDDYYLAATYIFTSN
ncbi:MAG: hypothetical protein HRU22_18610 [Gammaproteobacteria bacterium]|nr:hypothetical protein [Gammaproteobacteria bacterium]